MAQHTCTSVLSNILLVALYNKWLSCIKKRLPCSLVDTDEYCFNKLLFLKGGGGGRNWPDNVVVESQRHFTQISVAKKVPKFFNLSCAHNKQIIQCTGYLLQYDQAYH